MNRSRHRAAGTAAPGRHGRSSRRNRHLRDLSWLLVSLVAALLVFGLIDLAQQALSQDSRGIQHQLRPAPE